MLNILKRKQIEAKNLTPMQKFNSLLTSAKPI